MTDNVNISLPIRMSIPEMGLETKTTWDTPRRIASKNLIPVHRIKTTEDFALRRLYFSAYLVSISMYLSIKISRIIQSTIEWT